MKKYIILLIMLVVLTGCTANLNINIGDSSISEELYIKELKNLDDGISYEDYIDEKISENLGSNTQYDVSNINDSDYFGVKMSKKYDTDICSFVQSSALKLVAYDIKCEKDNNKYKITGKASYFTCDEDCFMAPEVSSGTLNITLPVKAISSNASSIEENTYTWNLGKNEKNDIKLEFKMPNKKDNRTTRQSSSKEKKLSILIIIIIIGTIVIISIDLYGKYKSKKLKY